MIYRRIVRRMLMVIENSEWKNYFMLIFVGVCCKRNLAFR